MIYDYINQCDCERLRDDFIALKTDYQEHHAYNNYSIGIEKASKTAPKRYFFGYVYLKKMRVEYPSIMNFEHQPASGLQAICDLFVTYTDDPWASSGTNLLDRFS
jgi:hypothetical protein